MESNFPSLNSNHVEAFKCALASIPSIKICHVNLDNLGKPAIAIRVYFNSKEDCANNILQNGRHRFIMLHHDGELVNLTGYNCNKLRNGKVKSVEAAIAKVVKWAESALVIA